MIEILLLLALPASGKSELRRYLDSLDPEVALRTLGIGPTVQIDDFPYVHLMRRFSQEAIGLGLGPPFFGDDDGTFIDGRDWGTLIHLVNEDFRFLTNGPVHDGSAGNWLTARLAEARAKAGGDPYFPSLSQDVRSRIELAIEVEARDLLDEISERRWRPGQTIVIEFARGMPAGSECPPPSPLGYGYSLPLLAPEILDRARILYVQVSPEESRRKSRERTVVGEEGSILHHGVPEQVMLADYGGDDAVWLMNSATRPGTIDVGSDSKNYQVPAAIFDNRGDLTSFLRAEPESWGIEDLTALRVRLEEAFGLLRG